MCYNIFVITTFYVLTLKVFHTEGDVMLPGVYTAVKKDGTTYYRSNITYQNKHISLGSYKSEYLAHQAYTAATAILKSSETIENLYYYTYAMPFEKIVTLINFRDNKMYIPNPIYLRHNYFSYYLDISHELKFDIDDLFYYSQHRIMKRRGHLYVNDYGMQVSILSRYGIRAHSVCGRDYVFINGDQTDMRYSNIEVLNPYHGVTAIKTAGHDKYRAKIHINGNYIVGTYNTPEKAAIAYNKAVDEAKAHGITKNYPENYIEGISAKEYVDIYTSLKLSKKYMDYLKAML